VVDILGGTFGAVGVLAALRERESTGRGRRVTSALFESTALLVAQHMAQFELTGDAPPPMSVKRPLERLRHLRDRGRRPPVRRRGHRHPVGNLLPRVPGARTCRRPRLQRNGDGVREREWLLPRLASS